MAGFGNHCNTGKVYILWGPINGYTTYCKHTRGLQTLEFICVCHMAFPLHFKNATLFMGFHRCQTEIIMIYSPPKMYPESL